MSPAVAEIVDEVRLFFRRSGAIVPPMRARLARLGTPLSPDDVAWLLDAMATAARLRVEGEHHAARLGWPALTVQVGDLRIIESGIQATLATLRPAGPH